MQRITVAERRARVGRRHRLAPDQRAADVVEATRSMVVLHATDPATVYLSAWARVVGMTRADMEQALYVDRTLVKHLAMRRTLFVFVPDTLDVAQAAASNRVAAAERRRLVKEVEGAGMHADGAAWLAAAEDEVLAALVGGREATSSELRAEIPLLQGSIVYAADKPYGGPAPVGPRVLTVMSAAGLVLRSSNDGGWNVSRPRWTETSAWLGRPLAPPDEAVGTAALVEQWLRTFGPGTVADLKWWLRSTLGAVRRALSDLQAVEVDLDGRTGYLLPDDLEPTPELAPWAALLPPLDPTTMGWSEREWYLGPYKSQLFDSTGNAGSTAWWDGRVVGGWRQDGAGGAVVLQVLEDIGSEGVRALQSEAERLTAWLAGARVLPRFPSPLWKELGAASGSSR